MITKLNVRVKNKIKSIQSFYCFYISFSLIFPIIFSLLLNNNKFIVIKKYCVTDFTGYARSCCQILGVYNSKEEKKEKSS